MVFYFCFSKITLYKYCIIYLDISRDVKDVKEESITISSDESDTTTGDVISNNSSSAAANTITTSQIYNTSNNSRRNSLINSTKQNHYGSFYLRMGAVGKYL